MALQRNVSAGINADLPTHPLLISRKIAYGTKNIADDEAINEGQLDACLVRGIEVVDAIAALGCNILLLGEAGVGSITTSAALMHAVTGITLDLCVSAGSGVGQLTQARKKAIIDSAIRRLKKNPSIRDILCAVGGEITMMAAAILCAAELRMPVVIDGFVTVVAALIASRLNEGALDYCIFSNVSDERGYRTLLTTMKVQALLPLSLHRGEGLAATLAYPIVAAACTLLQQAASYSHGSVFAEEMAG